MDEGLAYRPHPARIRSLFGAVELRVPRLHRCGCAGQRGGAVTAHIEGLNHWVSPELEYMQSRLAATVPYARASEILSLLLPARASGSASSIRRRALAVGRRLEADLDTMDSRKATPPPRTVANPTPEPITMGLDGGFVRNWRPRSGRSFEVIVGRIVGKAGRSRSLGFVRSTETASRARKRIGRRVAEEHGTSERITLFTDGDTDLGDLQRKVLLEASHVLDWYHLSRKLTAMRQLLVGEEGVWS